MDRTGHVLVTGAAGNFCRHLVPRLIDDGYPVRAFDVCQMDYACDRIIGSVADYPSVRLAAAHVDTIIHAAGLHSQLPRTPDRPDAYDLCYQVNVTGTHHVLRAAVEAGVSRVIYISSLAYYQPQPGYIDEDAPPARPARHYYDLSKVLGEDLCRYYAARHGLKIIALRPGNFTGCPEPGIDFLTGRLRREDVAMAARLALTCDAGPEGFEAFNVVADHPFGPDDVSLLAAAPLEAIDRHFQGAAALLRSAGVAVEPIRRIYACDAARRRLGFHAEFTFARYLESLAAAPHTPRPCAP